MKNLKRLLTVLLSISMMASVFAACSGKEDTKPDASEQATTANTAVADVDTDDTSTITVDEAIKLVKQKIGKYYSYIPAGEPEEINGSQYYVIYVKRRLDSGTYTTIATYLVKTDGSEVFDKYANVSMDTDDTATPSYLGEYVYSGATGETTFTVSEDGTFKMTTTGDVNQVISGVYQSDITNSVSLIKLILHPKKIVTEKNGKTTKENVTDRDGIAFIEHDQLTLSMESEDTLFIKK